MPRKVERVQLDHGVSRRQERCAASRGLKQARERLPQSGRAQLAQTRQHLVELGARERVHDGHHVVRVARARKRVTHASHERLGRRALRGLRGYVQRLQRKRLGALGRSGHQREQRLRRGAERAAQTGHGALEDLPHWLGRPRVRLGDLFEHGGLAHAQRQRELDLLARLLSGGGRLLAFLRRDVRSRALL